MSEEVKRALQVIIEAMRSVCYTYGTDFHDHEKLHETVAGEELLESVVFQL